MNMSKLGSEDESKFFCVSDYKPIVTYTGDVQLFKRLEIMLIEALPQERAEWRRSYGRGLREFTISATFIPFNMDVLQKENNFHLLQQPILHTFWTQCPDVETYKSVCCDDIKRWLHVLLEHDINDWLIILVESDEIRKYNKLLPRTTVLDKIKSDCGVKHVDRCLSLNNPLKPEFRAGSSWRTLVVNIRLLILTSYDQVLSKFEDYIRSQRESRNQPEWSFCDYFLLQEELAFALEMLGLYEEALIQYDELEALFAQFIRNSSLTDAPHWLSCFQVPINGWLGVTLSVEVNQSYRDAIRNHHIPLLDFRCYLFCRQAALLLLISKPWEVAQRTLPFIYNCISELKILEILYPVGAISCWIFVCCFEIILMCQNVKENAQSDACSLFTAPLMELAMFKLRELGQLCGLMPNCQQTSGQLHTIVGLSAGIGDTTNEHSPINKLKETLCSKEAFCKMYLELCEQAVIAYKHKERIRSARFIEKQLADFYMKMGDLHKASQFLINPLSSYEVDNWPKLANDIRLHLLECYKKLNEVEKLLRTSIIVACSSYFDVAVKISCFNDVMRILQDNSSSWVVLLEEGFVVENIVLEVVQNGFHVRAMVHIFNKFPSDIICSNISITVHNCLNDDINKKSSEMEQNNVLNRSDINYLPAELPLLYTLNYQQDKSLGGAHVICKSQDAYLKRKSSKKLIKPILPAKQTSSNTVSSDSVILKPGLNSVLLESKNEVGSGSFCLGQLYLNVSDKLIFLSPEYYYSDTKYHIDQVTPKISILVKDNSTLVAGVQSIVKLQIDLGTYRLIKDSVLIIRTSKGLTIGFFKDQPLESELNVNLSSNQILEGNTFSIPVILCSDFLSQTEVITDHKLWFTCPWSNTDISLVLQFFAPFIVLRQVHTIRLRKFLQITVTGSIKETVMLRDPELLIMSNKLSIKSLNPSTVEPFVINSSLKVKFMWELVLQDDFPDKCTLQFGIIYSVHDESISYTYTFDLSNFMTLYSVESKVDPVRGCEFCRVNTMCHLSFTVKKITSSSDYSLKYEVITDQTMWAVCNVSSGVIILDDSDECSITVDLMPLNCGYLPLPIIKLSKYFPAHPNIGTQKMSPRFEPFCQGQIFNANKATQVQVLPPVNVSEF